MTKQLQNHFDFHHARIALIDRTIAKVESGAGTMKQQVLAKLHETKQVHEGRIAQLERPVRERDTLPSETKAHP